jgi:hypothetical protein
MEKRHERLSGIHSLVKRLIAEQDEQEETAGSLETHSSSALVPRASIGLGRWDCAMCLLHAW